VGSSIVVLGLDAAPSYMDSAEDLLALELAQQRVPAARARASRE